LLSPATYTFTLNNTISTQGYKNIKISWGGMKEGNNVVLEYSTEGGTTYYRLKQVNFDGTFEYSPLLAVHQIQGEVKLFPNPATDQITVYCPVSLHISRIYITDLTGNMVKEQDVSGRRSNISVPISDLQPGIYILNMQGPDCFTSQKIQKK
jgi:trimeric autotransporter adhesin